MKIRFSYLIPLVIAAFTISLIGAVFSVTGLAKLFAGASLSVMFMAGALEFAKVLAAGFVHRYWKDLGWGLRIYLSLAVFILMAITSAGIFGFLSHAYQNSAVALVNLDTKIQSLSSEDAKLNTELKRIEKNINDIPEARITRRLNAQKEYEPQIKELNKRVLEINTEINQARVDKTNIQAKIGPLAYLSESFNVKMDVIARWFIFIFVLVFDPLAIVLVIATSWLIKHQEKEAALAKSQEKSSPTPPSPPQEPEQKTAA